MLLTAREQLISVQACDVMSANFIDHSQLQLNVRHRLKVGNACMIRSIEALQSKQNHPKFISLVGAAHAKDIAQALGVPSSFIGDKQQAKEDDIYYTKILDYVFFTRCRTFYASDSMLYLNFNTPLDQTLDS